MYRIATQTTPIAKHGPSTYSQRLCLRCSYVPSTNVVEWYSLLSPVEMNTVLSVYVIMWSLTANNLNSVLHLMISS